jgi:two-component system LytT family response regulator
LLDVYLVDDEPLAISRLSRMLEASARAHVAGSATDPEEALEFLRLQRVDALFLDVQMPGLSGFELLARLGDHPPVVFTTAYDRYALRAFEVYAVDYLVKPVEAVELARALDRLPRRVSDSLDLDALRAVLATPDYPTRVASRVGDRVQFVDLAAVTHFYAHDKLTYAAAEGRSHPIDQTIAELEQMLDPKRFVRVHRSTLVNVDRVREVRAGFGGRLTLRLEDAARTEVRVARERARDVRRRLGF